MGRPRLFACAGFVGCFAITVRWLAWLWPTPSLQLSEITSSLAAILTVAVVLLSQIFRSGRVTLGRIEGAIAVYLLLGVAWTYAYRIVEMLHPGSFNSVAGVVSKPSDWIYYSFVTLTTVGYGDIAPVYPIARMLAIAEALTGQLYLAITIAQLVAMEVTMRQPDADQEPE